jgi:hypothetical protein
MRRTVEQINAWNKEVFSWGYRAAKNNKPPGSHIFESELSSKPFAEGYYVAKILSLLFE